MCNHTVTRCPCQELFSRVKKAQPRVRELPPYTGQTAHRIESSPLAASPSCLLVVMPMAWIPISCNASLPSLLVLFGITKKAACWLRLTDFFAPEAKARRPLCVHRCYENRNSVDRMVCAAVFVLCIHNIKLEG
jgi:hypothetical protein